VTSVLALHRDDHPALFQDACCLDHTHDAYRLARTVAMAVPPGRLLDIGCGAGGVAIPVLLARPDVRVTGVELSRDAAARARQRAALSGVSPRLRVHAGDAFALPLPRLPSMVANPPNTPLVRISRLTSDLGPADLQPLLLAKLEMLNPGGSVKDRIGLPMIEAAERAGLLRPGGTIIEPTSGNTGHGLAIAAALKGYRCIFVMADKQSAEKRALLRAYGAEVVVCPTDVEPESPESYYSVATRLVQETPGGFSPGQYWNQQNPAAHERTTGPEIWNQTSGRITHFVASAGTGGTITGTGRYLKHRSPSIEVIGADPEGSVLSGDEARPYLTEGVGEDFLPGTFDPAVVDRWVRVSDREAFTIARRLAREEGILAGGSSGTALAAARLLVRELTERAEGPAATVVVVLPDTGRNYLTKFLDDGWMAEHGFLEGRTVQTPPPATS
jgi:cystathionine beta-synthase